MKTLLPNICKTERPLSVCDCSGNNIKEEQRKCLSCEQERRKQNEECIQDHRFEYRLFCFALCFAIFFLYACGGSETSDGTVSENGSVSFAVKWLDNFSTSTFKTVLLHSEDVCVDYGIELIGADIFDAVNTTVASDSWPCKDHQGTLDEVPVGSGYSLIIEGTVGSGGADWRGEVAGITVAAGKNTDAGTVILIYVGDDTISPQILSTDPLDDEGCAPVNTVITALFSEAMIAASVNESTFVLENDTNTVNGTVTYDSLNRVVTFTPDNYLSFSKRYTATLTTGAEDMAGNQITEEVSWSFTTNGACDYDMDCDVDGSDLSTFVSEYAARSSEADLNDDGYVNAEDAEEFCRNFGNLPM